MKHVLPAYPPDHKLGMRVPRGGSSCAKCYYVRNNDKDCAEPHFQDWNGSEKLPEPANEYCCDFYEIQPVTIREKYWRKK